MGERQYKKSDLTRERILAAAEEEFSEKGFYGARVDEIAAVADLNKRMLYAHFGSKEGLYRAVLVSVYERISVCEENYVLEGADPIAVIKNIISVSFEFFSKNPRVVRILLWENLNRALDVPREELALMKAPTFEYMRKQIRLGQETGLFRPDADEYQVILSLMNFCFSYFANIYTMSAILSRELYSEEEVRARAEFVSGILIDYLTST